MKFCLAVFLAVKIEHSFYRITNIVPNTANTVIFSIIIFSIFFYGLKKANPYLATIPPKFKEIFAKKANK
jgi:hypothetical protein